MTTDVDPPAAPPASSRLTLGRPVVGAIGLLAVAMALGVGDLVAALVAPPSSPFLAVGNQFIRLTPEPLKEFATSTFGVHDKQVLLASMAVVITVVAVLGGLLSRRTAAPGITLVVVLGLVGATCAAASPTFTLAYLVAPLIALLAGAATFAGLHRLAQHATAQSGPPREAEDRGGDTGARNPRRRLVLGLAAALAGAGVAGALGRVFASDRRRRGLPGCRRRAALTRRSTRGAATGRRLRHLGHPDLDHPERPSSTGSTPRCRSHRSPPRTSACASTAWSTARSP